MGRGQGVRAPASLGMTSPFLPPPCSSIYPLPPRHPDTELGTQVFQLHCMETSQCSLTSGGPWAGLETYSVCLDQYFVSVNGANMKQSETSHRIQIWFPFLWKEQQIWQHWAGVAAGQWQVLCGACPHPPRVLCPCPSPHHSLLPQVLRASPIFHTGLCAAGTWCWFNPLPRSSQRRDTCSGYTAHNGLLFFFLSSWIRISSGFQTEVPLVGSKSGPQTLLPSPRSNRLCHGWISEYFWHCFPENTVTLTGKSTLRWSFGLLKCILEKQRQQGSNVRVGWKSGKVGILDSNVCPLYISLKKSPRVHISICASYCCPVRLTIPTLR